MNPKLLYSAVVAKFEKVKIIHPLHKAMLEECCETLSESNSEIEEKETMIKSVMLAFIACRKVLVEFIKSLLQTADQVILNYRNQTFVLDKNSPLLS